MSTIKELICNYKELARMLPMLNGITIIEYDGEDIQGSMGLYEYKLDNALIIDAVDRIIVCGKQTEKLQCNIRKLKSIFPSAKIDKTTKGWQDTDFYSLEVLDLLVFHMAEAVITDQEYNQKDKKGKLLQAAIRNTRLAYYACVLSSSDWLFCLDEFCLKAQLRLTDFEFGQIEEQKEQTAYCRDKLAYMKMCEDTLSPKDLFFQIVDEAEHGCEECNQCSNYGRRKQCPVAHQKIAVFYRTGMYVPKDEKIAHQWEVMASRQGYKPAKIQVAEDLSKGVGCSKSIKSALHIFKEFAIENDDYCINRLIQLVTEIGGKEKLVAIPYIAHSAMDGNEEMILKLSEAFQEGDYYLPKDMVQQEEWIRQGAENGNPRFVQAMAEMYEANKEWEESYKWYKNLSEINPDLLPVGKFEEIELKMLTNGASDEEIALKGMDYLYGYHGTGRDTHLAYRCLSYAKEKGIALAEGLLGQMYFYGIGVEKDKNKAAQLIMSASNAGDLLSRECVSHEFFTD